MFSSWVIFLLRSTDLNGLHPGFRFSPSLVDSAGWAHDGHRRLGRFLVDDGAFLCLGVLHDIELIGCEVREPPRVVVADVTRVDRVVIREYTAVHESETGTF